jgi:hypothetical protein
MKHCSLYPFAIVIESTGILFLGVETRNRRTHGRILSIMTRKKMARVNACNLVAVNVEALPLSRARLRRKSEFATRSIEMFSYFLFEISRSTRVILDPISSGQLMPSET